jgi:hypothetical protein
MNHNATAAKLRTFIQRPLGAGIDLVVVDHDILLIRRVKVPEFDPKPINPSPSQRLPPRF